MIWSQKTDLRWYTTISPVLGGLVNEFLVPDILDYLLATCQINVFLHVYGFSEVVLYRIIIHDKMLVAVCIYVLCYKPKIQINYLQF